MRILYFYQYFSTPKGSWGTRVYEFASEWVKAGHDVIVVTGIYSKSDITANSFIENQDFNGIKVKVLNITIDNKQPFLKRIWTFVQYAVMSSYYALSLPADVVIASSGPITVGLPGLLARYIRGRKLVFETRDLWPEGAIELGIIRNPIIKRLAYWFEKRCYKASSLIVTLSPGMKSYIEEKHHHAHVISVTNAANIELFSIPQPMPEEFTYLKPFKYAIYTGNIGVVNNSYWVYNAAKRLMEMGRRDLIVLMIGEGQKREELEQMAMAEDVTNFIRLPLMPKHKLVPLIQHALVSLVPLKGTPVLDTSSPNKFFESLAAGVPVIQNTQGWMKDFLSEHEVGFTINPDAPEELAGKLIELDSTPAIRESMREKSIQLAKQHFDKDVLASAMIDSIESISK